MLSGFLRRLAWPTQPGAFRLWLALVVVLHHFTRIEIGKAPVLVFFALSGFWVQRVWTERYAHARHPWLTFIISRWWRIAPVMLLTSALCIALWTAFAEPSLATVTATPWRQALSTVGILGYAGLVVHPVSPAWSLDIEMQFYLLAPALALSVRRWSPGVLLLASVVVFEWALLSNQGVLVTSFLPFFVIGMLAAQHRWRVPAAIGHTGLALAIALVVGIGLSPWHDMFLAQEAPQYAWFNMVLGLLAMPFALGTVQQRGDRTDAMLADQSYIVYMLHWPVVLVFRKIVWSGALGALSGGLALAGLMALACAATWRWLDRPLNRRRKRWVDGRLPVARPAQHATDTATGASVSSTKGGDIPALLA